jgi:hypothetical protein
MLRGGFAAHSLIHSAMPCQITGIESFGLGESLAALFFA